jgi:hypothetical protein
MMEMSGPNAMDGLKLVGERLAGSDLAGEVLMAGGTYMTLVHTPDERRQGLDRLYRPKGEMGDAALALAEEKGWPCGWLGSALAEIAGKAAQSRVFMSFPGLDVFTVTPGYLVAMRLRSSWREVSGLPEWRGGQGMKDVGIKLSGINDAAALSVDETLRFYCRPEQISNPEPDAKDVINARLPASPVGPGNPWE